MVANKAIHLAYFVTPHGFGHAARAAAVMNALHQRDIALCFEIFTRVPEWFFRESLEAPYCYHELNTDVGMVQPDPLHEDLEGTLSRLRDLLPFSRSSLEYLSTQLHELDCRAVMCDVAALGIAAARRAGLTSFLIENFTWDWIYEQYKDREPRFGEYAGLLRPFYADVDNHIQTLPACNPGHADLVTPPAARKPRHSRTELRTRLGLHESDRMVLITMGGLRERFDFLEVLAQARDFTFVIPGASEKEEKRRNLLLLPHHNQYYHPDLVQASDVVIGKLGYSTLAETYQAGVPFGYIARDAYPEIPALASFAQREKVGFSLPMDEFQTGEWVMELDENIHSFKNRGRSVPNGADVAAGYIREKLSLLMT
jgi:UDP:flavonoid glycosyltransferase YjiC (YdhE family)